MIIQRITLTALAFILTAAVIGCDSMSLSPDPYANAKVKPTAVKDGLAIFEQQEATWVFKESAPELAEFLAGRELAKHATKIKSVNGKIVKIKAPDVETITQYMSRMGIGATAPAVPGGPGAPGGSTKVASASSNTQSDAIAALEAVKQGRVAATQGAHSGEWAPKTAEPVSADRPSVAPTVIRGGYAVFIGEGAIWVFATNSPELAAHMNGDELAKHTTSIRATPAGIRTIKAPDKATIDGYLAGRPGFVARIVDGYLWVFYEGSAEQKAVDAGDELAKHVTKITSVDGQVRTVMAPDLSVLDAYRAARPGFATRIIDGYLWVFQDGAQELAVIDAGGELAKHLTKMVNVNGQVRTIKAADRETINGYNASAPGFVTRYVDGYLWVFRDGANEYHAVVAGGELAKHVTRMKAVDGQVVTIKSPDAETIRDYLASR